MVVADWRFNILSMFSMNGLFFRTETCRLLKIIELLMFNYRRADQLDLWKENTPYVFVRLIKQLNCSLNIIRTNNCRKSNCMH